MCNKKVFVSIVIAAMSIFGRVATSWAILPGTLDTSYQPILDGEVRAIVPLPDGKALIGGSFQTVNSMARSGIARLNADGSVDTSFDPGTGIAVGTNLTVNAIVVQPDGKLIVGGSFMSFNATPHTNLVRLAANGSVDAGFAMHDATNFSLLGFENYSVRALALQADGKVLLGSDFGRISRLNSDGSFDPSFSIELDRYDYNFPPPGVHPPPILTIANAIVVLPNQQFVVQGNFCNVNSELLPSGVMPGRVFGVARFNADGTRDKTFPGGPEALPIPWTMVNPSAGTTAMAVLPDRSVIIGGCFDRRLLRLDVTGATDVAFAPAVPLNSVDSHDNNVISSVLAQDNGKVLVSGPFASIDGEPRTNIVRLNIATGALDDQFDAQASTDIPAGVLALQPDGNLLLGGSFTTVNGVSRPYLARWYGDSVVTPPLKIVVQPADLSISEGQTAVFNVQAEGSALYYQWFQADVAIPGATNSSLIFTNTASTAAGIYSVAVSNDQGSLTSKPATLVVHRVGESLDLPEAQWQSWWQQLFSPPFMDQPSWFFETTNTYDGVAAAQTANFPRLTPLDDFVGYAYLQTSVTGPGLLTFHWKIEGGYRDESIGLDLKDGISMTYKPVSLDKPAWKTETVIIPSGIQTLTWNSTLYSGKTTYLDEISFTPGAVTYALQILPRLQSRDSSFQLRLQGPVGCVYQVQTSADLKTWSPLILLTNQSGVISFTDDTTNRLNQLFYRALIQ